MINLSFKKSDWHFSKQNNVSVNGSLKVSRMSFVLYILNMCFLKLPKSLASMVKNDPINIFFYIYEIGLLGQRFTDFSGMLLD